MAGNPLANMMNGGNNPIMQMANILKSGGNPSALLNQLMQNNPQMQQYAQMMNGRSPEQLGEMVRNVAKERGADLGQIMNQLGVPENIQRQYLGTKEN